MSLKQFTSFEIKSSDYVATSGLKQFKNIFSIQQSASGTTTQSVEDTIAFSSTISDSIVSKVSVTDSVAFSSTISDSLVSVATLSESLAFSSTISDSLTTFGSILDSLIFTSTISDSVKTISKTLDTLAFASTISDSFDSLMTARISDSLALSITIEQALSVNYLDLLQFNVGISDSSLYRASQNDVLSNNQEIEDHTYSLGVIRDVLDLNTAVSNILKTTVYEYLNFNIGISQDSYSNIYRENFKAKITPSGYKSGIEITGISHDTLKISTESNKTVSTTITIEEK